MDIRSKMNMTMLCDFYELTMGNGYFDHGLKDRITYFDVFFRSVPDGGGMAIAAGLEQVVDYIKELHFSEQDIEYLQQCKEAAEFAAAHYGWIRIRCAQGNSLRTVRDIHEEIFSYVKKCLEEA